VNAIQQCRFDARVQPLARLLHHLLTIVALIHAPLALPRGDTLKIQNIVGGGNVIVMMDARKNGACSNDVVRQSSGDTLLLDNYVSNRSGGKCNAEIAIFAERNAMSLETDVDTWTDQPGDVHTARLMPVIDVPVSIWIASADKAAAGKAREHIDLAEALFRANKVGVHFVPAINRLPDDKIDAIARGVATRSNHDIYCTDQMSKVGASGFYTAKALNVYYVNVAITGRNCAIRDVPGDCDCKCALGKPADGDANITYIGNKATATSLAHEIGHAFGLRPGNCAGHTNDVKGFGPDNIMWAGGGLKRKHFTLGQVFRMNTQQDKWGGSMLIGNGLRPEVKRKCPPNVTSDTCPALTTDLP
jgi:hypothetical protein